MGTVLMFHVKRLAGFVFLCLIGAVLYKSVQWDFVATLDFRVILEYKYPLMKGAAITLTVTAIAIISGLTLGIILAVLLHLRIGPFKYIILGYIELWRNTPLIVQLFWFYFALPELLTIQVSAMAAGVLALTAQSSAYLADVARGGISAVPKGQWEASYALGFKSTTLWGRIILPQAIVLMLPAFSNLLLSFLNGSALLGLIQVGELMTTATHISDYTFKPIEILSVTVVIYLLINASISGLSKLLENSVRIPK